MHHDVSAVPAAPRWERTFYPIWVGQLFSLLGSAVVQFALIWWLTIESGSAVILTLASLAGFLPQALLGPFVGVWVDRWSRKACMIGADLAIALATLALMGVFAWGRPAWWMVMLALAVRSVGAAFHGPALQASIPLLVPDAALARVAGLNQAIASASNIAGPVLAGLLIGQFPMPGVLLVDVVGALVACATLAMVRIPRPPAIASGDARPGMLREMAAGFRALTRARGLVALLIALSVATVVFMPVGALFPLLVFKHFGGTAMHASIAEAAFGAGLLAGSLLLSVWGGFARKVHTIILSLLVMGAALVATGLLPASGFVGFLVFTVLLGASGPLFSGPFTVLLQTMIAPAAQGRVFSLVTSIMLIAAPVGLLLAGPGAERMGVPAWYVLSGVLIVGVGAGCLGVKMIRQLETTDEETAAV